MSSLINLQKPLYEYTDLELKAIAFDETQIMKMHERNVQMIISELERRNMSKVVANINMNTDNVPREIVNVFAQNQSGNIDNSALNKTINGKTY